MKNGISKEQSKMLQGFAILMMLYHHLFSTPEALGISYFSVLNIGGINIELHMAWFFKMCVAVYAFVSGYGLCRRFSDFHQKNRNISIFKCLVHEYRMVLKQLLGLFLRYWLVFCIFIPIGFIFYNKAFSLSEFLMNLFGLSSSYNGAWWYMLFYLKALLSLPLIDILFVSFSDKSSRIVKYVFYGILIVLIIGLAFYDKEILMLSLGFFQPAFYLCFLMGYLLSRFKVYEFAYKIINEKILDILGVLGFLAVIVCRVKIAKDASSAGLDFIFVPVFAFGFCVILDLIPKIDRVFAFFGKYSSFIWLTHVFFYDHYAKNVVMFSRISTFIYLTLLVMSTLAAFLLELLFKILCGVFKKTKVC